MNKTDELNTLIEKLYFGFGKLDYDVSTQRDRLINTWDSIIQLIEKDYKLINTFNDERKYPFVEYGRFVESITGVQAKQMVSRIILSGTKVGKELLK